MSLYSSNANTLGLTVCVFVLIHVCVRLAHNHRHAHTLIEVVKMKKYLEAGIIRANSIGLWYFIIHLPTTPATDGHIFFLHFVFSLINGVELMKMAQSGLVHHWRTAFPLHNVQVSCVSESVLVNFSPEGSLSHLWFFYDKGGFATYRTPPPAAVAHMHAARCMLHTCMLHAAWSAKAGYGVEAWQHYLTLHWTPTQSDDL